MPTSAFDRMTLFLFGLGDKFRILPYCFPKHLVLWAISALLLRTQETLCPIVSQGSLELHLNTACLPLLAISSTCAPPEMWGNVAFWGDKNVLELGTGDSCIAL